MKTKRLTVWNNFEQGTDIQDGSPKALCKGCWKVFAHSELRTSGSSTSTIRRHAEHKRCGGSKTGQGLISQFGVSGWFLRPNAQTNSIHSPLKRRSFLD